MSYKYKGATENMGYDFIPSEYIPPGKDEYWLRNLQGGKGKVWRSLESKELEILIGNNNTCTDWDRFVVSDPFDPSLIRNSNFYGLIRIGTLRNVMLRFHDFYVPAGIRNSTIISCDIGDDVSIQDCSYVSHYIIGDDCILFCINEMQTTNHAKFGSGVVKDGESEDVRIWIDVMNEAGGRSILPFPEILPADAYLWACYRDDTVLNETLKNITQREYGNVRGAYGVVGSNSIIKSTQVIKDTYIGEYTYIKGANKIKNVSILSSKDEPSQIGEGVELVNGIVGYGCHAFYGVKAVRFVMGRNSSLKYGARLIHSVLGDNSTVSCCEILNNLIFPVHEQHHNNSFLIASLVEGMSNMAAGVTIGSNHNSRANDGEIRAGRGFWPGLSVTLKHSSLLASFVIIAKGDFPYELNITFPFSLVNNNPHIDRLEIMPAYFWMYNLYALERNSWKTYARDKRKIKKQFIEGDYLAPDTAEEIITALTLMESLMKFDSNTADTEDGPLAIQGMEKHTRNQVLLKPRHGWAAYRDMLYYYSLKTMVNYLKERPELNYQAFVKEMEKDLPSQKTEAGGKRVTEWVNMGGQIAPAFRVDELREKIKKGELDTWESIHSYYEMMLDAYALDKTRHAWEVYRYLYNGKAGEEHPFRNLDNFKKEFETLIRIRNFITEQVYSSREKDYNDSFRTMTYRNKEEMEQVLGNVTENSFIKLIRERKKYWNDAVKKLSERL